MRYLAVLSLAALSLPFALTATHFPLMFFAG